VSFWISEAPLNNASEHFTEPQIVLEVDHLFGRLATWPKKPKLWQASINTAQSDLLHHAADANEKPAT
jgi:hypothetical protein